MMVVMMIVTMVLKVVVVVEDSLMIMMMNHDSPPSVLLGLETISSVKEEQLFWLFWQLAHTLYIIKRHI